MRRIARAGPRARDGHNLPVTHRSTGPRYAIIRWLVHLPRPAKRGLMLGVDVCGIPAMLLLAFALKYDSVTEGFTRNPYFFLGILAVSIPVFGWLGLYRSVVRYIGPRAVLAIVAGVTASAAALAVMAATIAFRPVPPSLIAIYWLLALVWVAGTRFMARWILLPNGSAGQPVVIYGAGEAGARLAVALSADGGLNPVAYVDEKRALHGSLVQGVSVVGPEDLPGVVRKFGVKRILMAVPTATRRRRAEILRNLEALGLYVQSIPSIDDILTGRARVDELRDVDVADLLGRDAVPPDKALLDACIRGKSVLVSGAGGSIGSELCRQILREAPRRLCLLEMSELALYEIERELREVATADGQTLELVPLLGDLRHKGRVREILEAWKIETVYHAAAYKHVPIVEQNVVEGIRNNLCSTWHLAEAAIETGVETFVFVSTDKAVNPTNAMGASKRFAEIILQGLQRRGSGTRFCMVRFGNVLESSGSVVPLFREQIRRGGPVTVTHPDVMRYFMTIPEAAQLVIQAGSLGRGGDVFVLDMGKPIRIAELARRMVQLSGLTVRDEQNPDGDIEVRFTGLRPAEKLYEELLIGKNVEGTEHPAIMRAIEHSLPWDEVKGLLDELAVALDEFDYGKTREILSRAVREYQPADQVADLVWARRTGGAMAVKAEVPKVTDISVRRPKQPS